MRINQDSYKRSLTLIELTISICIFSLIILSMASIDTFTRDQVVTNDKRLKLQSDAIYVLEHMARKIMGTTNAAWTTPCGGAIGDINNPAITAYTVGADNGIKINIDSSNNGKWDGTSTDRQIAYQYNASSFKMRYYPDFADSANWTNISSNITRGSFDNSRSNHTYYNYSNTGNFIEVQIGTCWNTSSDATCGNPNNPGYDLKNRIYMPAVSTH